MKIVTIAAALILSGCAATKPVPVEMDPHADALHNVLRVYCINGRAFVRMTDKQSDQRLIPAQAFGWPGQCKLDKYQAPDKPFPSAVSTPRRVVPRQPLVRPRNVLDSAA